MHLNMFPVPCTPFPNQFRADLRAGKRLIGCWVSLAAPITAEILGLAGFDWIWQRVTESSSPQRGKLPEMRACLGSRHDTESAIRHPHRT
jgi:2-keto-3-deoxy-L-rhamnonate aldolase RhmA